MIVETMHRRDAWKTYRFNDSDDIQEELRLDRKWQHSDRRQRARLHAALRRKGYTVIKTQAGFWKIILAKRVGQ